MFSFNLGWPYYRRKWRERLRYGEAINPRTRSVPWQLVLNSARLPSWARSAFQQKEPPNATSHQKTISRHRIAAVYQHWTRRSAEKIKHTGQEGCRRDP